ncbi:hypothetical protein BIZ38_18060 [Pseudoalteromonas sp. BZK2]|uniref:hypothetical protein n=1 Tax=Pseudoalteromonas sp. BZK2 TaxID=1904458 RepID=UPI0016540DC8|nr:hypothetical protein [Pseudoalteromonas sp. BZK2]MBC7010352.1 hypothetical protein [Pseudoalteromonas sp. BZK2]
MKNMLSVVILSALCSFSVNATQCEGYVDKLYKLSNGKVKVSLAQFSNTYDIKDESDLILITNAALANKILKLSVVEMDGSIITNSNANCGDNDADDQLTVIATSLDF